MKRFKKQLSVISILAFGLPAIAADPTFGMVGMALGQTLRLNVVAYPGGPCKAQIGFANSNGAPSTLPDKIVALNPGQADSLDVSAASLGLRFGQRVELRPIVAVIFDPNAPSACAANAEVFDQFTGRTWAYYPSGAAQ